MKTAIAIVALAALLTGCQTAAVREAANEGIKEVGAEARALSADAVEHAENYICKDGRIGPILERYANDKDKWEAYKELCGHNSPAINE